MKFKTIRIVILLLVLAYFVSNMLVSDGLVSDWGIPLKIVVYPVNADQSDAAKQHIDKLTQGELENIKTVLIREGRKYQFQLDYLIDIELTDPVMAVPPQPPQEQSISQTIIWSLMLRYWVWKNDQYDGLAPDVRVFVLFFDPETSPALGHSTGLEKGRVALVNAFATENMHQENNFVILHEILHTLGASDKYSFSDNQPIHPDGYAEPDLQPLFPQRYAEIMGGRIPLSKSRSEMPDRLKLAIIGATTASEIGWIKTGSD